MKFNLNDFLELDTNGLFAVNGGTDCHSSSYSPSSTTSEGGSGGLGGRNMSIKLSHKNKNY